jgi:FkbM family methyltransferase
MDNFFDKSLHFLGKTNTNIVALNIGSMDGVMFDEMIGYTTMYNFKVLYVEPVPYLFERLKNNIKGDALFENSAISEYNGTIEMLTIDKDVIDSGLVHSCFYGMSAVYPPKNGLGSEFDRPTVEKYGKLIKVPCITFETLMNRHTLNNFDIVKIDAEGHDFKIFKQIDLKKYSPKVIRLEWINLSEEEQKEIIDIFNNHNFIYEISGQDIVGLPKSFYDELKNSYSLSDEFNNTEINNGGLTLVTGLWDIGRGELQEGWSRSFKHYLDKFQLLLQIDVNMIIFGDEELEKFVFNNRRSENTQFVRRDLSWFKNNEFYDKIQKIRTNPDWYNQVGWLTESTQAKLEMYNPLVMSKVYLLHDAKILDRFDSEYMFWIDAGLTNTIHPGYFTHDKVLDKLPKLVNNFHFICFPYETTTEIHGFKYQELCELSGKPVDMVARAGFFGGKKNVISDINSIYYGLMNETLSNGLMGTEESLFTIMVYKYPNLITYSTIEDNGLMGKFFEDLKNDNFEIKSETSKNVVVNTVDTSNVGLYVITFNSPKQFEVLIQSMLDYDKDFINKPKKYLLNNSTDLSTTERYIELCQQYGFEHIKKDNIGIVGGRVFVADHFDKTNHDCYFWFEDDMAFYSKKNETCRNGFNRWVDNLYGKSLEILKKENFDFLKLNFTEFFGDNSTQWSWYNVPQDFRQRHWPDNPKLPEQGLDPNSPKTNFKNIKSHSGLPYATGEIYLCNWPILLSREGNYKCYLETKWAHPFEQTLMSYSFQETTMNNINPGLLLLTPTEHNRFDHYDGSLRKES